MDVLDNKQWKMIEDIWSASRLAVVGATKSTAIHFASLMVSRTGEQGAAVALTATTLQIRDSLLGEWKSPTSSTFDRAGDSTLRTCMVNGIPNESFLVIRRWTDDISAFANDVLVFCVLRIECFHHKKTKKLIRWKKRPNSNLVGNGRQSLPIVRALHHIIIWTNYNNTTLQHPTTTNSINQTWQSTRYLHKESYCYETCLRNKHHAGGQKPRKQFQGH